MAVLSQRYRKTKMWSTDAAAPLSTFIGIVLDRLSGASAFSGFKSGLRLSIHAPISFSSPCAVITLCVAIPAVVTGNPHVVAAWSHGPGLDNGTRRRNMNHHIGRGGAENEPAGENQPDQSFT